MMPGTTLGVSPLAMAAINCGPRLAQRRQVEARESTSTHEIALRPVSVASAAMMAALWRSMAWAKRSSTSARPAGPSAAQAGWLARRRAAVAVMSAALAGVIA